MNTLKCMIGGTLATATLAALVMAWGVAGFVAYCGGLVFAALCAGGAK